jgi:hypothetical protein
VSARRGGMSGTDAPAVTVSQVLDWFQGHPKRHQLAGAFVDAQALTATHACVHPHVLATWMTVQEAIAKERDADFWIFMIDAHITRMKQLAPPLAPPPPPPPPPPPTPPDLQWGSAHAQAAANAESRITSEQSVPLSPPATLNVMPGSIETGLGSALDCARKKRSQITAADFCKALQRKLDESPTVLVDRLAFSKEFLESGCDPSREAPQLPTCRLWWLGLCNSDNDADALSASYGYFEGYELRHMMVTIEGRDFHAYHQIGKRKRGRPKKLKQDPQSPGGEGGTGDGGFFSDLPRRPPQRPPAALLQPPPSVASVLPAADAANPTAPPKPQQSPPPLPPPRDISPGIGGDGGVLTAAAIVAGKRSRSGEASGKQTPTSKRSRSIGAPKMPSGESGGWGGGVETEEETEEGEADEAAGAGGCEEEEMEEKEESLPAGLRPNDGGRFIDDGFKCAQQVWAHGRRRWVGASRHKVIALAMVLESCCASATALLCQYRSDDVSTQDRCF